MKNAILKKLKKRNMSIRQLAIAVDIPYVNLIRYINGTRKFDVYALIKVANFLGLSFGDLCN